MMKMETVTEKLSNGNEITYKIVNGTAWYAATPDAVANVLGKAMSNRTRIRVFYGDRETGRDWLEEYSTMGYIGRSTGNIKIPLLVKNANSYGGGALLTDSIVRITIDKRDVYKHPTYHQPELSIRESDEVGYASEVMQADREDSFSCAARFKTRKQAERWAQFIKGERNSK
jgi:hypothetical protein